MRKDQLEQAIRTACQIIGREEVVVVGSQAILASIPGECTACGGDHVDRGRHPAHRGRQR